MNMKMMTIICRENLESTILQILNNLGVKGYTVMAGLGGRGQSGSVSEHSWNDRNVSFMLALEEEQATSVANAVKQMYVKLLESTPGEEVPLKVFLQPCDVIL
jgi:nitrogen regulatory protein PII